MILLTKSEKDTVINLLNNRLKVKGEVWVFGSRIKPVLEKKFSDLDLVFVGTPPLTALQIEEIKEHFSASDLPFRVDLCNLVDLPPAVQESINTQHEVLDLSEKEN